MKKKISIKGMSCQHCVHHVQEALKGLEGVQSAKVSLEGKFAEIEIAHDIDDQKIRDAVDDAGYEVIVIE